MKRLQYILLATLILGGCSNPGDGAPSEEEGQGSITFASMTTKSVSSADGDEDKYYFAESFIPAQDELSLHITGSYKENLSGEATPFDETFENITAFNTADEGSPLVMWSGAYKATLSNGADLTVENETNACFGSEPYPFSIEMDNYEQEATINVALQNSIIRMKCDEYFLSYFNSAKFVITTELGNEFEFDPFSADNEDYILFVAPDSELSLHGVATRRSGGSDVVFSKNVIGTAKAGYMNTIVVNAQVGKLSLKINLNMSVVETPGETVELNPLN